MLVNSVKDFVEVSNQLFGLNHQRIFLRRVVVDDYRGVIQKNWICTELFRRHFRTIDFLENNFVIFSVLGLLNGCGLQDTAAQSDTFQLAERAFQSALAFVHVGVLIVLQTEISEESLGATFIFCFVEKHQVDVCINQLRDFAFQFEKFFDANRLGVVVQEV